MVREAPVPWCVTVTAAPGTTATEESVILPRMVPEGIVASPRLPVNSHTIKPILNSNIRSRRACQLDLQACGCAECLLLVLIDPPFKLPSLPRTPLGSAIIEVTQQGDHTSVIGLPTK